MLTFGGLVKTKRHNEEKKKSKNVGGYNQNSQGLNLELSIRKKQATKVGYKKYVCTKGFAHQNQLVCQFYSMSKLSTIEKKKRCFGYAFFRLQKSFSLTPSS